MNGILESKAQEISFALLRVCAYFRRFELRKRVESLTYNLLENIYYGNYDLAYQTLEVIVGFLALAKNAYELEPINFRIIREQIDFLKEEIERNTGFSPKDSIIKSFSKIEEREAEKGNGQLDNEEIGNSLLPKIQDFSNIILQEKEDFSLNEEKNKEINEETDEEIGNKSGNGSALNQEERLEKIVQIIKALPDKKAKLRDFLNHFSGVSSRTIRYDLRKLVENGVVVRGGKGGPDSSYTIA